MTRRDEYWDDAISERAAHYLASKRGGVWSEEDQAELDAWLAESASHYVAWIRVEAIAARAHQLAPLLSYELSRIASKERSSFPYRRFLFPLLAAALIALIGLSGGPLIGLLLQPPDRLHSTGVGSRELLTFSDHTQIELNTDTAVRLRMTSAERTVWLDKGEAWFHVAHDAAHPFTVIVGNHRVTDLGTEFLVRRDSDAVDVTLFKGRAALSAPGEQTTTALMPGDEATATRSSLSVTRKTPRELANELAWRSGMLMFHDTPLAEVVRQFNRYNAVKLVIADPAISNLKITANTRTDDYESFLELAERVLKLRVDRKGSVILISQSIRKVTKPAAHARRGN